MITRKQVNKALAAKGYRAEIFKGPGGGYHYFVGDDVDDWYCASVPVGQLNALTIEEWVEWFERLKADKDFRIR